MRKSLFIKEDDMKRAKLNNDKITALYCRLSKDDGVDSIDNAQMDITPFRNIINATLS